MLYVHPKSASHNCSRKEFFFFLLIAFLLQLRLNNCNEYYNQVLRKCWFFGLKPIFQELDWISLQKDIKHLVQNNWCFLIYDLKFTPYLEVYKNKLFFNT